jgi:lipopolysaccharide export system permease protein
MPIKFWRLSLIDRYLLSELLTPFVGGIVFFTFVFLMFQILRLAEFFIIHGVPFFDLIALLVLLSASFIPFSLPISFLIGLLLAFGRLSTDSELVAMKAGGYSLKRLAFVPFLMACCVSILSLLLTMQITPTAEKALRQKMTEIGNSKLVSAIRQGTFTRGFFDLIVYADQANPKTNRMQGVFIYDEREPKNPLTIVANKGQWTTRRTENGGSEAVLKLTDGNIHRSEASTGSYQKIDFEEYRLFLKMEGSQGSGSSKPKMLTYSELSEGIKTTATEQPQRHRQLLNEWWRRIAVALAPFCFLLLGLGHGSGTNRSARASAALIAFAVVVLYDGLLSWGAGLAEKSLLPSWIALQLGNVLTAIWGVFAFRSALRT